MVPPHDPLIDLALKAGDTVRFQKGNRGRWHEASVLRVELDGSVRVSDAKGAARSIPAERLEVKVRSKRGASGWEAVIKRSKEPQQLGLL